MIKGITRVGLLCILRQESFYVVQADLKHPVFLSQPCEDWDHRDEPLPLAQNYQTGTNVPWVIIVSLTHSVASWIEMCCKVTFTRG